MTPEPGLSVVIPARNEEKSIGPLVSGIRARYPQAEIIVVDDHSTDRTAAEAEAAGARVLRHPVQRGNGAAVKTGARHASHARIAFMDADGQHDPSDLPGLLAGLDRGFDMVVGARTANMHAGRFRRWANQLYNLLASWMTGMPIADLTSGFRVARTELFRRYLSLLPNGFSYPTTITMAFLRAGFNVAFQPVSVRARQAGSSSHIRPLRDGARFFIIIFKVASLYSPLKIYLPASVAFFAGGVAYYAYTFITSGRFTNLGALLFSTGVVIFLIGLLSEQITTLTYLDSDRRTRQD